MPELGYERRLREWVVGRGAKFERLIFRHPAAGGTTVAYRLPTPRRPRALVLVVHGAGNDALFGFPGLFKELVSRGFEVFSFDLPGHGRHSTTTFSAGAVTRAVRAALEWARKGRGDLAVHAIGISLGGAILLGSLGDLEGSVASAALIAAPLRIHFSRGNVLRELTPRLALTAIRQRRHVGLWGTIPAFGPLKRDLYPLRLAETRPGRFGYIDALNELLEEMDLRTAARRTPTPTLLVYGTADRVVPPGQGEELQRLLPGSELLKIPGGTHLTTFFDSRTTEAILMHFDSHTFGSETR